MCGRYSFKPTPKQRSEELPGSVPEFNSMNIAPTQPAPVRTGAHEWALFEWGLVPFWSKDGKNQGKLINARAESIGEKPSFREAFKRRRCLVPADSFYEWRTLPNRKKVPYRIVRSDGRLLFFAGIWERWRNPDGGEKHTFSIVTTDANADLEALHDRMPVILVDADSRQQWLHTEDPEELAALLRPAPDGLLRFYRVTDQLNAASFHGNDAHDPVPEDGGLF